MTRVVIRPRIQAPLLVVIFAMWTLLGLTYFTNGDVVARRDWFGIVLGCVCVIMGMVGVWRALRLGVDAGGLPIRALGSYSRQDAERKVEQLHAFVAHDRRP